MCYIKFVTCINSKDVRKRESPIIDLIQQRGMVLQGRMWAESIIIINKFIQFSISFILRSYFSYEIPNIFIKS